MKIYWGIILSLIGSNVLSQHQNVNTDSLKWKMYTLIYNVPVKRFVADSELNWVHDSIFNAVQFEIGIADTVLRGDTVQYLMGYHSDDNSKFYRQKKVEFVGIGYIRSQGVYYAIMGQTAFELPLNFYSAYFRNAQGKFISYLNEYQGTLTPWIQDQLKKRGLR